MAERLTATVSLKDHRDWRTDGLPDGVVYIGRACYRGGWRLPAHRLGNPYSIVEYGLYHCLARYAKWVSGDPGRVTLARSLRGSTLACFCPDGTPCHAAIAAAVADDDMGRIAAVLERARGGAS